MKIPVVHRVRRLLLIGALAGATGLALVGAPTQAALSAGSTKALAQTLVTKFFKLVEHKNVAGLRAFLSPAFQLQRADGSAAGKADYLRNLPDITSFKLTKLNATRSGSVLVVRYLATVTGTINGKKVTPGPAPRLSVFVQTPSGWQIIAHSNFNPLTG